MVDEKAVLKLLSDHLGITPELTLGENFKLVEDLGADSLGLIELRQKLEKEFGLDIPDEDIDKIVTIQDLIQYLEGRLK